MQQYANDAHCGESLPMYCRLLMHITLMPNATITNTERPAVHAIIDPFLVNTLYSSIYITYSYTNLTHAHIHAHTFCDLQCRHSLTQSDLGQAPFVCVALTIVKNANSVVPPTQAQHHEREWNRDYSNSTIKTNSQPPDNSNYFAAASFFDVLHVETKSVSDH